MGEDKWTDLFRAGMWIEGGSPNLVNKGDADYTLPVDENNEINAPCAYGAQWMVLSCAEWEYLMEKRPDAEHKCGGAVVDGIDGWVILPDDWAAPEGLTFVADFSVEDIEEIPNQYTTDEWAVMEATGAVFLSDVGQFLKVEYTNQSLIPGYQTRNVIGEDSLETFYYLSNANMGLCYGCTWDFTVGIPVRLVQLQSGNTMVKVE